MQDDSLEPPPTPPVAPDGNDAWASTSADATAAPSSAEALETPVPPISPEALERSRRALLVWLAILVVFGVGGLALGQQETALLVAVSGVVIAAHAADFHPRFETLYRMVSVFLIGMCAATLFGLAAVFGRTGSGGPLPGIMVAVSSISGLAMAATGLPQVAQPLARRLFGARGDSHSFRLAARLTLFGFLIAAPGWYAAQSMFANPEDAKLMFSHLTLGGAVFGYVILALAAVGFLMRRDLRATLERLGLTRPRPRDLLLVVVGVPLLWGCNSGFEWVQQHAFHASWEADRRVTEALAGALDRRSMTMVALSAGIGEEITMRGALQPKLGLVLTSLFFAALHIQYSWYGMGTIFVFGLILGLVRKRTNTAVVMAMHALYDLLALFTS
jgi:hypothetical protein